MLRAAISVVREMTMLPLWISKQRLPDEADWDALSADRNANDTGCLELQVVGGPSFNDMLLLIESFARAWSGFCL